MENKYLVLDLTNGSGYTDPTIELFDNLETANAKYYELVGRNVLAGLELDEHGFEDNKVFCYFQGEQDNFGTHVVTVEAGQIWEINGDFAGEITLCIGADLEELIQGIEHDEGESGMSEGEQFDTAWVTDSETGTYYTFIKIK